MSLPESSLVSVIVPCYNAEQWVSEAIDSCLLQNYQPIEIIVVDDGSTDRSLEILRAYGDAIRLVTGANRGASFARNWGLGLALGEYVQFLDADDYLRPEKIARQVAFLEQSGADVVYGDWQHRFHQPDGSSSLGDVQSPGEQADVVESLLAGWWVANNALLFRNTIVLDCGGWDETLGPADDRDLFTRVALLGTDVRYQSGCYSVYRRHGGISAATWKSAGSENHVRWLEDHCRVLEKAESHLEMTGQLFPKYRRALATSYFQLARNYYDLERAMYDKLLAKALLLWPDLQPRESLLYNAVARLLGFAPADRLASLKRRLTYGPF